MTKGIRSLRSIFGTTHPNDRPQRPARSRLRIVEQLESRQLLASYDPAFRAPDLTPLLHQPNATAAMFSTLTGSLQGQIVIDQLASLKSVGNVSSASITPQEYVADVKTTVSGYINAAATQAPGNRLLNRLVQLQAAALEAQTESLKKQLDAGLLSNTPDPGFTSSYYQQNLVTVEHLTLSRPLWPYGSPILSYINRTEQLQADVANAGKKLGVAQAASVAAAEADSYVADIQLATVNRAALGNYLTQQAATLQSSLDAAAQSGSLAEYNAALATFTTATYDKTNGDGYLGPRGGYGRDFIQPTTDQQLPTGVPAIDFSDGNTFAHGRYRGSKVTTQMTFHRNFSEANQRFGRFVTTTLYATPAAAIRGSALDQTFGPPPNEAFYVEDVVVKPPSNKDNFLYVGKVAPIYQGIVSPKNTLYPGMGPQILIRDTRNDGVAFINQRTTGT